MTWIAGIDGCQNHWFVVLRNIESHQVSAHTIRSISEVVNLPEQAAAITVNCPIGLPDSATPGGRECDRIARHLLGYPRASSVFPVPVRCALGAVDYRQACSINAGSSDFGLRLARQTFGLFSKLREMDEFISPERQEIIVECHPELSFYELNGERPVVEPKGKATGAAIRRRLLIDAGLIGDSELSRLPGVGLDDVNDAYVLAWTAERIVRGISKRIPANPPLDSRGLRMEMWR